MNDVEVIRALIQAPRGSDEYAEALACARPEHLAEVKKILEERLRDVDAEQLAVLDDEERRKLGAGGE